MGFWASLPQNPTSLHGVLTSHVPLGKAFPKHPTHTLSKLVICVYSRATLNMPDPI